MKIFRPRIKVEDHNECKGHYVPLCKGCSNCEENYDRNNYPSNYDCPHYEKLSVIDKIEFDKNGNR